MSYSIFNRANDIPWNHKEDIDDYKSAFNVSSMTINWNILNQFKDRYDIISAKFLIYLKDMVSQSQIEWKTEVIDKLDKMIDDVFNRWESLTYEKKEQHSSSSSVKYVAGNIVYDGVDDGRYYLCIKDCTGNAQLTNTTYWQPLIVKGADSDWTLNTRTDNNWRGAYNPVSGMSVNNGDVFYMDSGDYIIIYMSTVNRVINVEDPSSITGIYAISKIERSSYNIYDSMPDNLEFPYNNPFGVVVNSDGIYETIDGEHSTMTNIKKLTLGTDFDGVIVDDPFIDGEETTLELALYNIINNLNL